MMKKKGRKSWGGGYIYLAIGWTCDLNVSGNAFCISDISDYGEEVATPGIFIWQWVILRFLKFTSSQGSSHLEN